MKNQNNSILLSFVTFGLVVATSLTTIHDVFAHSDKTENDSIVSELKLGTLEGVGSYKLRIDQYGEPAPMPLRMSLEIDCGASRPVIVFSDIAACGGGEVSSDKNNVVLSFLKPNKKEKCERTVKETIAIGDVCK